MFCIFFCDQIIGFDVTQNLVGGDLQLKPRMIHPCTSVSPRKCGGLWKLRRGTAVRGLSWGFVRGDALESCDPELSWRTDSDAAGVPGACPCGCPPAEPRKSSGVEGSQTPVHSLGLSLLVMCSSRRPGSGLF